MAGTDGSIPAGRSMRETIPMHRSPPRTIAALSLALATAAWAPAWAETAAAPPAAPPVAAPAVGAPADPAIPPAAAAPAAPAVTAERAQAIAATLDEGLTRWLSLDSEESPVEATGDVAVLAAGDHYEVVLPSLAIVDDDSSRWEIGVIRLTLKPRGESAFDVSLVLPSTMIIVGEGETVATLNIGRQHWNGIWIPLYEQFIELDAGLNDVTLAAANGDWRMNTAGLGFQVHLTGEGPDTWSGPGSVTLSGLQVASGQAENSKDKPRLSLGQASVEIDYRRLNLAKLERLGLALHDEVAGGGKLDPATVRADMEGLAGGGSVRIAVDSLDAVEPEAGGRIGLDRLVVDARIDALDTPSANASLAIVQDGLLLQPSLEPAGLIPSAVEIRLSAGSLPTEALRTALASVLATGGHAEGGDGHKGDDRKATAHRWKAMGQASDTLLTALGQAGTTLGIDRLAVAAPDGEAVAKGQIRATTTEPWHGTADITVSLRGLDEAVKALQAPPGKKADLQAMSQRLMLTRLQAIGQMGKDDAGRNVRVYRLELTGDGSFLVNGADLVTLMGMGGEGVPPGAHGGMPRP
jgi:hypothetical protein